MSAAAAAPERCAGPSARALLLTLVLALTPGPAAEVAGVELPDAVTVDGEPLGTVPGEAFRRAWLRIFIGDEPAGGSLKEALLGR